MKDDITFDEEALPVLIITFPQRETTGSDIQNYLGNLHTYLEKKKPLVVIINIAEASWLSAKLRFQINNWVIQNKVEIRKYMLGTGYIVKSQILRMALKTFLNFQNVSQIFKPVEVFNSLEKAKAWANEIAVTAKIKNQLGVTR